MTFIGRLAKRNFVICKNQELKMLFHDMSCRDTLLQGVHETLQTMERELKLPVDFN